MKLSNIRIFLTSRKSWTLPYIIFSAFFVVLPLILIVVFAFTDESGDFTFANFSKFMSHPEAVNTFIYSIGIAIINTLICILLGYPAAYILSRLKSGYSQIVVHALHPAYVGKHSDSYTCHCGTVRFLPCTVRRGSFDFRYGV